MQEQESKYVQVVSYLRVHDRLSNRLEVSGASLLKGDLRCRYWVVRVSHTSAIHALLRMYSYDL